MIRNSIAFAGMALCVLGWTAALFAQNVNIYSITQDGAGQSVTTAQGGAGNRNETILFQIGPGGGDNSAFIIQAGTENDNFAHIAQVDGSFNVVFIEQGGTDNKNDLAVVEQFAGNGNLASYTQIGLGNSNTVTALQLGGDLNEITHVQGGEGNVNKLAVEQDFDGNKATVTQTGLGNSNTSFLVQFSGSEATILQDGTGAFDLSEVTQSGLANEVVVTQGGIGAINTSVITQQGTGSFASVTQN